MQTLSTHMLSYSELVKHAHTHMYVHTPPVTRTPTHLLPSGQGCAPNASRAAEIFTELAMKGHPYAQVATESVTNLSCVLGVLFPLL